MGNGPIGISTGCGPHDFRSCNSQHKFIPSKKKVAQKRRGHHGQSILLLPGAGGGGLPENTEKSEEQGWTAGGEDGCTRGSCTVTLDGIVGY